jgi:hypothetical protein
MKNLNIVISIILFMVSIQIYSQNNSLQIGFGMHQDLHFGVNQFIDSILIGPNSIKDDYRPIAMISYQKRFKDKFEIEVGINYSNTYYSYIVGIYNPTFKSYTRKVGVRTSHTFTFPVNINISLTNKLYVKAGLSASLGILGSNSPIYFNNTPEINDVYNSMQNIFKPNSINYGYGGGYKIRRFDIVYFRKVAISKVTEAIKVNNREYEIFGKFYSNTVSLFYNFRLK